MSGTTDNDRGKQTFDAVASHNVHILKTRDDFMLDSESYADLVVASLLQRERLSLQLLKSARFIKFVCNITTRAILKAYFELHNNCSSGVVLSWKERYY